MRTPTRLTSVPAQVGGDTKSFHCRLIKRLEMNPKDDLNVQDFSCNDFLSCVFIGLCHRDGVKRRSYLSSQSDITDENQEADLVS